MAWPQWRNPGSGCVKVICFAAVLSCGTVNYAVQGGSNFLVCG